MAGIWSGLTGGKTKAEQVIINSKNKNQVSKESVATKSVISTAFYSEKFESAMEKYHIDINDKDAQKELIEIVVLSAIIAFKIKKFTDSYVSKDVEMSNDYLEWQSLIVKLTADDVTDNINHILGDNISIISESSLLFFSEILGRDLVVNGKYKPIESDRFKEVLTFKKCA